MSLAGEGGNPFPRCGLSEMRRVVWLLTALWLAGPTVGWSAEISFSPAATGGGRFRSTVESLYERRWKHVVRQSLDISCGSAALATILHYQFGDKVSEDALIRAILNHVNQAEVRRRGGFSLLDLKQVATGLGYIVHGYKISLGELEKLKSPAIVAVTIRGYKHFIVFRGMAEDHVVLADPAFGNTLMELSEFSKIWRNIVLLITKGDSKQPFPKQLEVGQDDLSFVESPGSVRSYINRVSFHLAISPDEF